MRLLLDTHFVLDVVADTLAETHPTARESFVLGDNAGFVSVVSLWEIAIKTRIGKLDPKMRLADISDYLVHVGFGLLIIDAKHVVAAVQPEPATRDPFDRLLLAQCDVENMLLVTRDRALCDHRLAYNG